MPAPDVAPGAPVWADLQTSDPARARDFYGALFGWTAREGDPAFGGYFSFALGDALVAGCMQADAEAPVSDIWSVYLAVDDAARTVDAALAAGGQAVVHPMPVGDLGTMAFVVDPSGAAVGLWQAGAHRGFGVLAEPGAPAWFELLSRDYAASLAFYDGVLGWRREVMGDTDAFRYSVALAPDGGQVAGVMDAAAWLPEGVPSHWSVYFAVADADAAVATATRLGGGCEHGPEDTPYGRLATVTDPMGARFKVIGPNAEQAAAG